MTWVLVAGSFNPQAHTTWVPVDWSSWPNYNAHGYGTHPKPLTLNP